MKKVYITKQTDERFKLHFCEGERMVVVPNLKWESVEHVSSFLQPDIPVTKAKIKEVCEHATKN